MSSIVASTPIRRALTLSFGASIAVQAMNVMTGVLLARTLGPEGRGALAAVLLWPTMLAMVLGLGVSDAVTFHIAREGVAAGAVLGSGLALAVVQAAACCAIGAAIIPLVLSHYDAATVRAAYVFLAFIPANLITLTLMSALNGLQRFTEFQALRVAIIAMTCLSLIGLRVIDNLTVLNAALVYVGATAIAGAIAGACLARGPMSRPSVSPAVARSLVGYGVKSQTGNVTGLMNERLDQLVISAFLAPARLGLYVAAVAISSLIHIVGSSVALAAFPVVAKLRDAGARRQAVRRFVQLALICSVAVAIPLMLAVPVLIDVFFKDQYSGAAGVSRVLILAAVVLSTNRAIAACLRAVDRPLDTGIAEVLALAVTVMGLAALLPAMGIMGAALVSLLAYCVSTAWMVRQAGRALDVSPLRLLVPDRSECTELLRRLAPHRARAGVPEAAEATTP